ncbi:hypothetical protein DID77_04185 [Candidatus Marinamargulisbacteria bacterium SCGC AG-439-L15]|nr:hypothetical protein DID77_04185 [Candidatus Marinamargulisbacteria bacterium SCGC AG-439-L15]
MMRAKLFGCFYKWIRHLVISYFARQREKNNDHPDLEDAEIFGDEKLKIFNQYLSPFLFRFRVPKTIQVRLHNLTFPSPLTSAAFKDDLDILSIWFKMGLGGVCLKTVMQNPREGNVRPRLQEVLFQGSPHLVNALGLPGPGVQGLVESLSNATVFDFDRPVGISLGGQTPQEYESVMMTMEAFFKEKGIYNYYYELNISCPNIEGGSQFLHDVEALYRLLQGLRKKTTAVLGIKISPELENDQVLLLAEAMTYIDKSFINAGNTAYYTCQKLGLPYDALSQKGGGLSGLSLFSRTLELMFLLAPFKVPTIATGGISDFQHVRAVLDSGATLVGMATALVQNPYQIPIINQKLLQRHRTLR